MQYVIAHTESSNGWGGQEIRVFTEMLAMRQRGHQLLLAAPEQSQIYQKSADAGLPLLALDDRKPFYPATIAKLVSRFRRDQVQVVNMHSSRDGWLGGFAGRLAGTPLIIRSRHIEVDYPNRLTSRIAFHHLPHQVLTTSQRISGRLVQELGLDQDRVACVPTGIDLARFDPALPGTLPAELRLSPTIPLVGMISVLRHWKGHDYFLAAAAEVRKRRPDAHFIIAGDGPGAGELPDKIRAAGVEGHVSWLGHREDVPNVLASLSVVVLPSFAHEGIPQIILQAQAMAKPVVGTTVGGIPEVIEDGKTGFLVPPREPIPMAGRIGDLLEDANLRARMGAAARERVMRENSLDAMCERLEALYAKRLERAAT